MRLSPLLAILCAPSLQAAAPAPQAPGQADPAGVEFFEKRIRPVLAERCYACHSAKAAKVKAELWLDSREGMLRGGESGPAVVPGDPEKSLLIKAIRYAEDLEMPPKEKDRLTREQVADFERWVRMGAPDPRTSSAPAPAPKPSRDLAEARKFWSLQAPREISPPPVADPAWPRNDVDRFILAKLEEKGLRPGEDADRRTLLRRATFDLTGLPPTPEEIEAFLADGAPDAFEKVVERLLASPRYGERWGRHWLDVVRYADTAGDNSDYPVPQLYRYRNWVIDAFNRDKPYDRFLAEQIAGDLMPSSGETERHEKIIATGYVALSRRFGSGIRDYPQHLTIEDTIDNLGRAVLGLTISCARCHDHKFDPISQEDYYGIYGIFQSTRYPFPGIELDKVPRDFVPLIPQEEVDALLKPHRERLTVLDGEVKRLEAARTEAEKAIKDAEEARKTADEERVRSLDGEIEGARRRVEQLRNQVKDARRKYEDFARQMPEYDCAYAVAEGPKAENARVQVRGEPKNPGEEVPRRFLEVLGGSSLPPGEKGSGRLELALWLTDPANPLTARVMVNRIWLGHFGRGLVPTPSDFGSRGGPPTHPELLDWLARRFVESGWSVKAMHRLIVPSRAYRLASGGNRDALYGRFERRRLDAESIRDAMLAAGGGLDATPGGAHPFPPRSSWGFTQHVPFTAVYESDRRSVYVMTQRIKRHPFFATFDGPDPNATTGERRASITPLQALFLMNDPFVHRQAERLAARLLAAPGDRRIELAQLLAFGRPPSPAERRAAEEHLRRISEKLAPPEAWASYARAILMANEFIYVD